VDNSIVRTCNCTNSVIVAERTSLLFGEGKANEQVSSWQVLVEYLKSLLKADKDASQKH
jgi:hypothetical protein